MKDNLVNGWYKCIKGNSDWTKGKLYYFENGFTKDDNSRCRPLYGSSPQKYNDPPSELWFELAGLVPADEKEVEKMKHDTMNDSRINGFYKATKTNASWFEGRQYYFRDGYTVDDSGETRPCGEPLKYWTSQTRDWLEKEGLVPATNEMDIFDRVNEAAVNCTDNHLECDDEKCPYLCVPNCRDQMIDDFHALRKMRENRKGQEYEAMPIQGGFVYDNRRKSKKHVIIGCFCRDKETLEVYKITDIRIMDTIRVDFESIDRGFWMRANFNSMDEFYEQFEPWERDGNGGSFDFVALEDLFSYEHASRVEDGSRLFKKGHLYSVVEGRVCNCDCDMRFRDFSEMASYFGVDKLIRTVGQGRLDDPTDGLYTGTAVFKGNCWGYTKGKIYRFVNGIVKNDTGLPSFWRKMVFADYFAPVKNLEVGEI